MGSVFSGSWDWQKRLGEACDQLVNPQVRELSERARQRRLIAICLAGPFLAAAAFTQILMGPLGPAPALAAICAVFVAGWSLAVLVAQTGRRAFASGAALAVATLAAAIVIHFSGGVGSPLFLAWLPLVAETRLAGGSRNSLLVGVGAALAAVGFSLVPGLMLPEIPAATPAAGHWLLPVLYVMSLPGRLGGGRPVAAIAADDDAPPALDQMVSAVVFRFGEGGEVIDVSARAQDMLGLEPAFLLGEGLFERIHVADRVHYLHALADLRAGVARRAVELRLRLPDGEARGGGVRYRHFLLELVGNGVSRGEGGRFFGLLRCEDEKAELRQRLEEAEGKAVQERTRFLATISHEMRTPLNAIIGFSDMLLEEMAGPLKSERQRDYVGLVQESGQHLLAVVNSILDLAKIEAGTFVLARDRYRFEDALETSRAMVSCQAKAKGITVRFASDGPVGELIGDRRAIQQILINLLSNAVKFTPEGGDIVIDAARDERGVTFTVSDTGIGIAVEDLERIGRPFVQVINDQTRGFEGTGLGLALVKGLVERHRGSLSIESALGAGMTVSVTLPYGDGNEAPVPAARIVEIEPGIKRREEADDTVRKFA